ncbi:MAG: Type secretory pathway, VirB3-like protein [Pseudomonadota bacterium]
MVIAAHPVYKGCLRKALLFGIPLLPCMVMLGLLTIFGLSISLWFFLLVPVFMIIMRFLNAKDDCIFEMIILNMLVNSKILKSKLTNNASTKLSIVSNN